MGKYLHKFESFEDFDAVYNGNNLPLYFETADGTYYYSGEDDGVHWWVKDLGGENEHWLFTQSRIPKVGIWTDCENEPDPDEFPGAVDDEKTCPDWFVEITSVQTFEGEYVEPWVSYTEYGKPTGITGVFFYDDTYEGDISLTYDGEVDYERAIG